MWKTPRRALTAIAVLTAIGCGGDDDGSGPTGSISLTASPTALSVPQGGTGQVTVTLVRGGGFSDPVNVTVEGLPNGATATVQPTQLTGNTTQATVTVTVASTVAAGAYPVTVRGSATGIGSATAPYTLTVTAAATPNYTLSMTPTTVTAPPGGSGQSTVNITRTNFTGAVTLSLDAPPAGVTATFNPAAPTGNTSTATINVASTVANGNYTLTIKGAATGVTPAVAGLIDEAAAAGDRTTTLTLTVAAVADFTISAAPNAGTAAPGGTVNSTITIARTNHTADIALSLVTPPAGITGAFTPATLTGAVLTSNLVLNIAGTVAAGVYPVTVQGTGGGVTKTTVVTVTVAAASGDFTISASPNAGTAAPGGSVNSTITIARTNHTADVALTLVTPPAGITGTFTPATLSGAVLTSNLVLNIAGTVAAGVYPVTVQGAGGGVTKTTVVTVTVAAAGGNIVWDFCTGEDLPLKFWRLSGTTWAEVAPTTVTGATRYTFSISSQTGGVAFTISNTSAAMRTSSFQLSSLGRFRGLPRATRDMLNARSRATADVSLTSPYFDTMVFYGTSAELSGTAGACPTAPTNVTKTFTVAGQAANEEGLLGYGPGSVSLTPPQTSFNVQVPAGTYDYMAMFGPAPSVPDFNHQWAAYRIGRGEAAPGATVAINRTGATAFTTFPFTVSGGNAGAFWSFEQSIMGARGAIISFPIGPLFAAGGAGTALFLAPADRLGTDMVSLGITYLEQSGNNLDLRNSIRYLGSAPPASGAFALPAAVPPFTVSQVQGAPVTTWSATGPTPADYQTASSFILASFEGTSAVYSITATRAWLVANNMSTNYTLAGPTLPNFLAQWAPASPLASSIVSMVGGNFTTTPVAGSVANFAIRQQ
jgi:hypothetical protein